MDRYKFPIILDPKMNKLLVGTLFAVACISSHANDLNVADDFKSGDLISADTFNQIFDTIEKINRTVVDSNLVGTWTCSAIEKSSYSASSVTGWTERGFLWELTASQLNLMASSSATSLESPFALSTSAPSPLYVSGNASTGTYILYKGMLFVKGVSSSDGIDSYDIDLVSGDRFILKGLTSGGHAVPDFIMCDSAEAVPASPTSPTATNNKTGINLAWTDASSDETGFKVY